MTLSCWYPILGLVLATGPGTPPRTFRVDYFHTGSATEELFSLDRLALEPLPWPGSPARAIDDTNFGKYLFEVRDQATNRLLYSRGFSSIFGEWETTPEAKQVHRTYHESLRFPAPGGPVQVLVKKRDARDLSFREVWSVLVDPQDMLVDPSLPPSPGARIELQRKGDPADKVDLLILGDGYTAAERPKFEKDARRLVEVLFSYSPFKERRSDFNVWGLCPAASESGISRPSTGIHRRSPLGATYDALGAERFIFTYDNKSLRDAASFAPYDFLEILVNSETYGGGGIYNLFATVAADNRWNPYLFVHEFGHLFAGLGDEYFTTDSPYQSPSARLEPWEPNVTAATDARSLKWKASLSPGVSVPTPWDKAAWEARQNEIQKRRKQIRAERRPEAEMDALFLEEKAGATKHLTAEAHYGKVGAFEGANYESKGFYRPQLDCVMFTRDDVPFCSVCRAALERIIDQYAPRPGREVPGR
ncbi:MAG: IgA Peptidase M64 [Deltaproteobacteria bacterium]|nr:IgA Peptidase M64 [Deltaproteobacteria bacterium]